MKKPLASSIIGLLLLVGAHIAQAATGTDTWTGAAGTANWSDALNWSGVNTPPLAGDTPTFGTVGGGGAILNMNLTSPNTNFLGLTFNANAPSFVLTGGTINSTGGLVNNSTNLETINLNVIFTSTHSINAVSGGTMLIGGVISGAGGTTKTGGGTVTLTNANTYTGITAVNSGTLSLDFTLGTPAANIINPASVLNLGGGTLNIIGNASASSSQTFASTTFTPGNSVISAAPVSGANNPTLSLGALTFNQGGAVSFVGPATQDAAGSPVAATAVIKTTSVGGGAFGLMRGTLYTGNNPANAGYATVGLYDWASTSLTDGTAGTSPYTVIGGSQVTGFYTTTWSSGVNNFDMTVNTTTGTGSPANDTVRFNTPTATVFTERGLMLVGGFLITPNMGTNNASVAIGASGGPWQVVRNTGGSTDIQGGAIWQNNPLGYFTMNPSISDGRDANDINRFIKAGNGTVLFPNVNTYRGITYINGGNLVITADSGVGDPATAAAVSLNGGTLFGNATFTLDNAGANKRPITLLSNGGGAAAAAGNTMTIDGIVSGAGSLTVGIGASSANGNVQGLLPGSGSIANGQTVDTANPTPVLATGTVELSGANTYTGGTILQSGTLKISGGSSLGTGGVTFNGGTFQWNGVSTDISAQAVSVLSGGGTLDVNGSAVTLASSIGKGGNGAVTVKNSGVGGGLFLNGGTTYTGNTTVSSGGTLGGTGTIAGNVTWFSGAKGSFTQGSPMTISGTATLNNNAVTVNVPGAALTDSGSPYTLMTSTGGITGGSTVALIPTMTGSGLAAGYNGAVTISGNSVLLTVTAAGVIGTWTDGNATENWSEIGNWSGGVPHLAGSSAVFNSAGGSVVTLDANQTVGSVTLNNPSSDVITGSGTTLTMDNNGFGAAFTVSDGAANVIAAPVALKENTTVTVGSGKSVAFSGIVSNTASAKTLAINGAGTTILSAANTYGPSAGSVGTTLSGGGTLQVGNNTALGAGDLTVLANSTLKAGAAGLSLANKITVNNLVTTTVDNNGNNLSLAGVISGGGTLTKNNAGTLTLGSANTYSGGTIINGGAVSIASAGTTPGNPGSLGVVPVAPTLNNIILNGGDLLATGSFDLNANRGIGIGPVTGSTPATALVDVASGQIFNIAGIIASAGNLGTNNLTVNSGSGNNGTLVLSGANTFKGATIVSNGVLQLANPLALQNSTLNYDTGKLLFDSSITATTLGGLSGSNPAGIGLTNLSGAPVTLTVGNNNSTTAYYGGLSGSGALGKTGTGTLTITNATYSGGTIVYAGGLNLNAPSSVAGHFDISAQFGVANVTINGVALTSANGLYITSATGGTGTIFGNVANLTITNGAQVTANADGGGRALSYGMGNGRPGGNGSLTVGTAGDTTTLVTANGALDMFYSSGGGTVGNFSVNLNGGTLAVNGIQESTYGSQSGTLKFNGGILKALASDGAANFFPSTPAQLTAVVNGGAVINPNGYSITIDNALTHGAGTPDGGLTVFGGGRLTLTASNSYTGITIVSNAILSVNNTTGSGTGNNVVNVLTNGYLGGSGTISGDVTINNYGHTLPGGTNGNVAGVTTTVSNLTFTTGSEADFNLSNLYYSGNDQITVSGALVGNGVSIGINLTDLVTTNLDTTGDYVLFHITGTYISGFNLFPVWLGATPSNAAYYSIVYNGTDVVLHYSPIILASRTVNPNPATRNQVVTFSVNATSASGINPSTGIYVDATPIGGSSTFYLVQSNGTSVYTNSLAVANGTALGTVNLALTLTDNGSNTRNDFIPLTINSFSEVWNGLGGDNQWATGANWVSGLPPAYGDALTFAGTTQLAANMESSYSIGAVTFTNGAGAFNLTNEANTLTLLGHGVTNLSASVQTFSVPVYLTATPTLNAAAGNIVLNNPVSGDGQGVVFAGTNTTTLAGINTYTGNTAISAGTLAITGAGQLANGAYAGNITNSGTLSYNSSANQTLSGILSGPGAVVHNGSSTLTLSGANAAYTGAITVNKNSILLAGASGSLGTGTTTLMSGTLGASVNGLALNGSKLAVPSGTNGLVNMTAKMRLPALYGAGTLAVNVNSTSVTDPSNSGDSLSACANFTGTLNLTGQVANAQMSCFFNGGSFDGLLQNATVNLLTGGGGGVSLVGINNSGGNTAQIGALNVDSASSLGGSAYAGTQTYQIGALGGISDIEGAVIGNGAIIKVGSGTLLLNNSANTYTGKTTVSAGTLLVNGQITTSPITVGSGGKLSGTGIIGAPTTNSAGAILNPGNNNVGTLTFNNNLVLSATSTNRFVVTTAGGASNSVVVSGGTLIANNSVIAINTAGSATLGAGTNVLFTYSSISGSFNAAPVFDTAQTGPATAAFIYDNGSQIALVVPAPSVNTNPTNITAVVTGNSLSLTWPGDHLGWTLQTNSVDLANTNYWFAYPGSASVTNVNITINPAKTNVFFRLVYP